MLSAFPEALDIPHAVEEAESTPDVKSGLDQLMYGVAPDCWWETLRGV